MSLGAAAIGQMPLGAAPVPLVLSARCVTAPPWTLATRVFDLNVGAVTTIREIFGRHYITRSGLDGLFAVIFTGQPTDINICETPQGSVLEFYFTQELLDPIQIKTLRIYPSIPAQMGEHPPPQFASSFDGATLILRPLILAPFALYRLTVTAMTTGGYPVGAGCIVAKAPFG